MSPEWKFLSYLCYTSKPKCLIFKKRVTMNEPDIVKAVKEDNYIAIKKAISNGADPQQVIENELNENEESLIFYAIHNKCSYESIKLLIDNATDIFKTDAHGVSLLDEAIVSGDLFLVKYLVEKKEMDVNFTKRGSGFTPLMQAACYGYEEIVKYLLEKGADINAKDSANLSVIEYTKKLQRKSMQKFLENYIENR